MQIENQTTSEKERKPTWGERYNLIKDYFVNSDEKRVAWLLVAGILLCLLGTVALTAISTWLFTSLWTALIANAVTPFCIALAEVAASLAGMTILYALQNYLIGELAINWRFWFCNKIKIELFESKEYINVKRTSKISDIPQIIQEDIREFVKLSISLGTEFISSTLTLGVFISSLWVLSGSLSFALFGLNIVIPGYLVWASILIAMTTSLITYVIGQSLPALNQKAEHTEASFRQHLEAIYAEAENIELEQTGEYHYNIFENNINNIKKTEKKKLWTQTLLVALQNFCSNLILIAPLMIAAPLYFNGLIGIEQINQISISFSQVSLNLNWFAQSFEKLANYQTKMDRIIGIYHAIKDGLLKSNPRNIKLKVQESTSIIMEKLSIQKPLRVNTNYMMRNLNLELKKGEHTLILGPSGLGKSTFFKAIRGTWGYGEGKIRLPKDKTIFFLAQKPTVLNDTLSAILASPRASSVYTKEEYLEVIRLIRSLDEFTPVLDKQYDWNTLSGGQKQMISFARALLQKPDWLFLDEVSSSLDEDTEKRLYKLLKEKLPDTTIVSIAHRSTVETHHKRVLEFGCPNEKKVMEIVSDRPARCAI